LIGNEVCREFIIYFLYRQEDYSVAVSASESMGTINEGSPVQGTGSTSIRSELASPLAKDQQGSGPPGANLIRKSSNFNEDMTQAVKFQKSSLF